MSACLKIPDDYEELTINLVSDRLIVVQGRWPQPALTVVHKFDAARVVSRCTSKGYQWFTQGRPRIDPLLEINGSANAGIRAGGR
jgi:hypothetical protein